MKMIKNNKAQYELAIMILAGHGLTVREYDKFYDVEFETYEVPEYRGVLTPIDEIVVEIDNFLQYRKDAFFSVEGNHSRLRMETASIASYPEYFPLEIR